MQATDLTPGLIFALGWLTLCLAAGLFPIAVLVARMIRKLQEENGRLTTAVLAMSRHSATEGLAIARSQQEAMAAMPPPQKAAPGPARAMRPVGS